MLENKVALITGATAGIGKAIAEIFSQHGAHVIIIGTNKERAEEALAQVLAIRKNNQQKACYYLLDVSNKSQVEEVISKILQEFGSVDILVNNAGIARDNLLMKMSEEDFDRVIAVNLKSVYNTCQALVRSMMRKRSGKIINISSVVGLIGNAGQANYAASKAGVIGFTKSLAKELASRNICVNCIAPGYIETQMTDKLPNQIKESIIESIPLKKIGSCKDIANTALFLALSDYITGQVIAVDGGMVM